MTVIMDNAAFHKSPETRKLIESAGCRLLFLPPYSPDLNPIENTWHEVKSVFKRFCDNDDNHVRNVRNALNNVEGR